MTSWYVLVPLVFGLIIFSFVVGALLANRFRLPDHGWKIGVILCSLSLGIFVVVIGWPPRRGIDLSGGMALVYDIDHWRETDVSHATRMDRLLSALRLRVNPGGVKEPVIREYGNNQVEIIVPEADENELRRIKDVIQSVGMLEFRILANNRDHVSLIERARLEESPVLYDDDRKPEAWWVPVKKGQEEDFPYPEIARRPSPRDPNLTEILVVRDPFNVTGEYLQDARTSTDRRGRPCVLFRFDSEGAHLFGGLTGASLPDQTQDFTRKLGIILDGLLYSAPAIQSTIYEQGEITGSFSMREVEDLVHVLNAGSLPATLSREPISELLIGPTLGQDTIRRGAWSIGLSALLVFLFMVVYYRFAGIVACMALLTNIVLILALMILVQADFTLPGLAGLVLTVGMAVDANVLIFERVREERERGGALRMAIRNGFGRATTTIVDANITTLITGIILYWVATDQVRGFAVTLILGVVLSMYTAIFCSRVLFDVAEKRRWLNELTMMRLLGSPRFDFLRWWKVCGAASIVLIGAGMVAVGMRGQGILDVDFTGGVSVEIVFKEPKTPREVREKLAVLPDLAVTNVRVLEGPENLRFVINTSFSETETDEAGRIVRTPIDKVEEIIQGQFPRELASNVMTIRQPEKIEPREAAAGTRTAPNGGGEAPRAESAAPSADGQTRRDLPPHSFLAQADAMPDVPEAEAPPSDAAPMADTSPAGNEEGAIPDPPPVDEPGVPAAPTPGVPAGPALPTPPAPETPTPPTPEPPTPETPAPATPDTPAPETPAPGEQPVAPPDPFAGGTLARLEFSERINHDALSNLILQRLGPDRRVLFALSNRDHIEGDRTPYQEWTVRIALPPEEAVPAMEAISADLASIPYFPSSNTIGGKVAREMRERAVVAIFGSLVMIVLYIWVRFQRVIFGLAAVIALIHDVLFTLGLIGISAFLAQIPGVQDYLLIGEFKIGLVVLAAFLTIIGYSLNDTIIIFDRIREVRGKAPRLTADMVNLSINQTLSRTILTSGTTLLVVVTLYAGGGQAIHTFAFALLAGIIVGTYSSVFVAAPIVLWMSNPKR